MNNYAASPLSRRDIRNIALNVRRTLRLDTALMFPIVEILDIMGDIYDDFNYEIVEDDELPRDVYADTDITNGHMRIKESVYNRACAGIGRDRFTLAHELGHFILHHSCGFRLNRISGHKPKERYRDPEWQADCFAGELLIPSHLVKGMSPSAISVKCGVSWTAASVGRNRS